MAINKAKAQKSVVPTNSIKKSRLLYTIAVKKCWCLSAISEKLKKGKILLSSGVFPFFHSIFKILSGNEGKGGDFKNFECLSQKFLKYYLAEMKRPTMGNGVTLSPFDKVTPGMWRTAPPMILGAGGVRCFSLAEHILCLQSIICYTLLGSG